MGETISAQDFMGNGGLQTTYSAPSSQGESSSDFANGTTGNTTNDPRDTMVQQTQQQQQTPSNPVGNFLSDAWTGIKGTAEQVGQNIGNEYMGATQGLGSAFGKINQGTQTMTSATGGDINPFSKGSYQNMGEQMKGLGQVGEGIAGLTGNTIRAVFAPITGILKQSVKSLGEGGGDILGVKGGNVLNNMASSFDNTPGGQKANSAVSKVQNYVSTLVKNNPGKAQAVNDFLTTIMGMVGEEPTNEAGNSTVDNIKTGLDTTKQGASDLADSVKSKVNAIGDESDARATAKSEATTAKNNQTASDLTGKIIQGKTGDLEAGQHSLLNVDASKINSLSDLSSELGKNIETNTGKLDEALASDKTTHPLSEFDSNTQAGGKTITSNPVKDAISQLSDLYEKTNDTQGQARMADLEQKANGDGLTAKDLNDLAREHSQAFDQFKANANGEYASGLNKQAARNTYTGVKNAARGLFGNEAARDMDSEISDDLNTKKLVDQQVEKENTANQKTPAKGGVGGVINKITESKLGGAARDVANLKFGSAAGKLMPSGELSLNDMLTKLQNTVSDGGVRDDITSRLQQAIDENNAKPEPIAKGETTTSTVRAADLGQQKMPSTIKVNDYRSQFPKYLTSDQINKATDMLNAQEQAGHTIDMKAINQVVKRVTDMEDIKPIPKQMANAQAAARLNRISKIKIGK